MKALLKLKLLMRLVRILWSNTFLLQRSERKFSKPNKHPELKIGCYYDFTVLLKIFDYFIYLLICAVACKETYNTLKVLKVFCTLLYNFFLWNFILIKLTNLNFNFKNKLSLHSCSTKLQNLDHQSWTITISFRDLL